MSVQKYGLSSSALAFGFGISILARNAHACGGEWYPEVTVDPRIQGVSQAEKSLANGNRLAAAASVIRMIPHIKTLEARPGSLVARVERMLAVALSRSEGKLPVQNEVPVEVLGSWQGKDPEQAGANLAWSIQALRRQAQSQADDVSLQTDPAEALARLPEHQTEARTILAGARLRRRPRETLSPFW